MQHSELFVPQGPGLKADDEVESNRNPDHLHSYKRTCQWE